MVDSIVVSLILQKKRCFVYSLITVGFQNLIKCRLFIVQEDKSPEYHHSKIQKKELEKRQKTLVISHKISYWSLLRCS